MQLTACQPIHEFPNNPIPLLNADPMQRQQQGGYVVILSVQLSQRCPHSPSYEPRRRHRRFVNTQLVTSLARLLAMRRCHS